MTGRLPQRIRGVGWEVWVDERGILWTRDEEAMDHRRAEVRVEAMERYLARRPVLGVLVDDHDPVEEVDHAEAWAVYRAFLERHPALPVAVVTRDPRTLEGALDARGPRPGRLAVFATIEAAQAWLMAQRPRPVA
jgi:hypothetical protein